MCWMLVTLRTVLVMNKHVITLCNGCSSLVMCFLIVGILVFFCWLYLTAYVCYVATTNGVTRRRVRECECSNIT